MASATGIPENVNAARGASEQEPLLGRRGDASQMEGQTIWLNLWLGEKLEPSNSRHFWLTPCSGTAPFAQAGIWIVR
jgi:hypothetical protein